MQITIQIWKKLLSFITLKEGVSTWILSMSYLNSYAINEIKEETTIKHLENIAYRTFSLSLR